MRRSHGSGPPSLLDRVDPERLKQVRHEPTGRQESRLRHQLSALVHSSQSWLTTAGWVCVANARVSSLATSLQPAALMLYQ
jgi:hypothetical protein